MGRAGPPACPASSCRCASSRACSAASFSNASPRCNEAGRLAFFGDLTPLADKRAFDAALAPLRRSEWVVYAKRPFAGPKAALAYLSRYTHRVAISNSRLIALDQAGVTFKWKDYRIKGRDRLRTMTLDAAEFIRRFLLHVLPNGFHRIRHYGLFAGTVRARNIERVRQLLAAPEASPERSPQRGGQRGRKTFALASMSGLRRPDDHRRNIRRRAFFALAVAEPDQDRHLMTVAALPATQRLSVSLPATRRSGPPLSSHRPQTLSRRRAHARPSYARDRTRSSPTCPSIRMAASGPRNRTRDPSATFKSP